MKKLMITGLISLMLVTLAACDRATPITAEPSPVEPKIPSLALETSPVLTEEWISPSTTESRLIYPEEVIEPEPETADPSEPVESALAVPVVQDNGYAANIPLDDPKLRLYQGVVDPRSIEPHIISGVGVASLVNKYNALPWDYAPTDLVSINANGVQGMLLREPAAAAWEEWRLAALNDGYSVLAVSSYRSRDYQAGLFNSYLSSYGEEAILWSAYPRRSEHEMGLVVDLSYNYAIPGEAFSETAMGQYLAETAHLYGFILRYPKAYEDDTGYTFEPWHFRFVGKNIARQMKERSIPTLEHYYELTINP